MAVGKSALEKKKEAPCRSCALAAQCPTSLLPEFDPYLATLRSYRRRQMLQREGDRSGLLRFVKSGLVGVRQVGPDGIERNIAIVGQGHLIGQPMMRQGWPALVSAEALTSVSVCEFSVTSFQDLPGLNGSAIAYFEHHMRQSITLLVTWSHLTRIPGLEERMAAALRLIASTQPATATLLPSQAVLAELLCVTRESVNRLWRDFEQRGLVRRGEGQRVCLDLDALARQGRDAG